MFMGWNSSIIIIDINMNMLSPCTVHTNLLAECQGNGGKLAPTYGNTGFLDGSMQSVDRRHQHLTPNDWNHLLFVVTGIVFV